MTVSHDFFPLQADHPMVFQRISGLPLALAIGVFDGVHLGHRKLLNEVRRLAEACGALPVALTFAPHPRAVLRPEAPPGLLIPLAERLRLLRENGMAGSVVIPFTGTLARTEPEDFLDGLFADTAIAAIGVGAHWRFGRAGRGDAALLAEYARKNHWRLAAVPELELDGEPVSATRVRRAVAGGDLDGAARLLGYPYCYIGRVRRGYGIAGSRLDCPTANIVPEEGVLPPDGVYAGIVYAGEGAGFPAAVNIGIAPTYAGMADRQRRIEAHLLDFAGDLYGRRVRLELRRYLRSERCFASEEELKRRIAEDVAAVRRCMTGRNSDGRS